MRRFVSIWFRHLATDWFSIRQPALRDQPLVLRTSSHGRMVVTAANIPAKLAGISVGMVLADARAIMPEIVVHDDQPDLIERLLKRLAEWCIRFTPVVAVDLTEGLILDASGCSHLWGGDDPYLEKIVHRLATRGYDVRAAMADTAGAAWAAARFGKEPLVLPPGSHVQELFEFPPEALRLDTETVVRLRKLGLLRIGQLVKIPRSSLRRRFGQILIDRLDQALGRIEEQIHPVQPVEPYHERLPCLEPIFTATGIEIALDELLRTLCGRLQQEQKGLRVAILKCFRIDGKEQSIRIETSRPTHSVKHLFKLLETKISTIEPDPGIELFVLEAPKVEDQVPRQEKLWERSGGLDDSRLSELIDRLSIRLGSDSINRYLPAEHYWPERSLTSSSSLVEPTESTWRMDVPRPVMLLRVPVPIDVTAPIPDYPPMLFRFRNQVHNIVKADGPERIEQEWWLQQGQHRDYYQVEDEEGKRYWIFRLGHYDDKRYQWFLHGLFA